MVSQHHRGVYALVGGSDRMLALRDRLNPLENHQRAPLRGSFHDRACALLSMANIIWVRSLWKSIAGLAVLSGLALLMRYNHASRTKRKNDRLR